MALTNLLCSINYVLHAGCILADDMGLGKTLQGISLLWTLLTSGHPLLGGDPVAKRIVIVCPTSLVGNWDSECQKWLKVRHVLLNGSLSVPRLAIPNGSGVPA